MQAAVETKVVAWARQCLLPRPTPLADRIVRHPLGISFLYLGTDSIFPLERGKRRISPLLPRRPKVSTTADRALSPRWPLQARLLAG